MYYNANSSVSRWGWYTTKNADCQVSGELHDINGDGQIETGTERHCIPNGEYTLHFYRVTWDGGGQSHTDQEIFQRPIAMLDRLGSLQNDPSAPDYHDARVAFDLVPATTSLAGDIRAGDVFRYIADETQLYPLQASMTVAAGDTLWLISTYVAQGSDSRPWYDSKTGVFTSFNPNYDVSREAFGPAVNSIPVASGPPPMLQVFAVAGTQARLFRVVGRVTEPYHDGLSNLGRDQTSQSITVTVVPPVSCFTYSGTLTSGQQIAFDGRCSAYGAVEYSWSFGDGTAATAWSADSGVVRHAYASGGTYPAQLNVRRQTSTAPVATSSQSVPIAALDVAIVGPDAISSTGTYQWDAVVTGGQRPLAYRWYYKQGVGAEQLVDSDSSYSRFVVVGGSFYSFRLRVVATDARLDSAVTFEIVEVWSGGGSFALIGALDPAGECSPLPTSRPERQRALAAIIASGRWPVPCRRR